MTKLLSVLLASLFATAAFAASHTGTPAAVAPATSAANPMPVEAMKAGDAKAEDKAQAKVDARTKTGDKKAMQPEAMTAGSEKAEAKAEMKKNAKVKTGKKNSTDEQMKKDGSKL
jgi:hypothetical protein